MQKASEKQAAKMIYDLWKTIKKFWVKSWPWSWLDAGSCDDSAELGERVKDARK